MTAFGDVPPEDKDATHEPQHAADDLGFALPEPAKLSATRAIAIGAVGAAVLAAAFVVGYLPRVKAKHELAEATRAEDTTLRVQVATAKILSSDQSLVLPGSVQALEETIIYPRASGYVRAWKVDIGDKVKEGDVLAEIETPELDQQLDQARAQLAQAEAGLVQSRANAAFSKQNLDRYTTLAPAGVASQQELDQHRAQAEVDEANVNVAQANVEAQRANIRRLTQLKSFARVTAPFAGTVTSRTIDRGTLVSAGTATPLFKLSAIDPARVFVQVPQDVAPSVRANVPATVTVREYPGRNFEGTVARSAGALDPMTRTMNTEVRVPNPKGELISGMYAQVSLTLPSPHHVYEIPSTALMNDAKGLRVATVTPEGKIHLVPVTVERDTGKAIQIASGLDGTERIVRLASADLVEGRSVEVSAPPPVASAAK